MGVLCRKIVKLRHNNVCQIVTLIVLNAAVVVLFFSIKDGGNIALINRNMDTYRAKTVTRPTSTSTSLHYIDDSSAEVTQKSEITRNSEVTQKSEFTQKSGVTQKSEVTQKRMEEESVYLFDVPLRRSFFPDWFWDSSMADLSRSLSDIVIRHGRGPNTPIIADTHGDSSVANWIQFKRNMRRYSVYDPEDPTLGALMKDMSTLPIVKIDEATHGTQLKMIVTFEDGGRALLKPKRVTYRNNDRHFAEIAAFHLDRLMGFYRVPPTVGRNVNIATELVPLFSKTYKKTVYQSKSGKTCFIGQCSRLCTPDIPVCGTPADIEVSLQYVVPTSNNSEGRFGEIHSPWKPIKRGLPKPEWVSEAFLCNKTRHEFRSGDQFLIDVLDAMFFDVIIDNIDRHHFAMYTDFGKDGNVILLDQGKGFKSESHDEVLDLFLYKRGGCCLIRKTSFLKYFKLFFGPERLSDLMRESMAGDPVSPVLTKQHLKGLDRRVNRFMFYISECLKHNKLEDVIVDDLS